MSYFEFGFLGFWNLGVIFYSLTFGKMVLECAHQFICSMFSETCYRESLIRKGYKKYFQGKYPLCGGGICGPTPL